ncbi:MAG: YesL family protein [Streptococcaceae bacterium]|jgi:uncharacterized membrane protein YesL|nr:YesL family protein [Streptococcaceae bacterium]
MKQLLNLDSPIMRLLARFVDLIILNSLFILTSLPLITIGASLCALQTSIQNILHKKDAGIARNYFRIFIENFRQATVAWLMLLSVAAIVIFDFQRFGDLPLPIRFLMGIAAIILSIIVVIEASYLFAYIGRYQDTLCVSTRNVLVISLQNLLTTAFLVVYNSFIIYFSVSSPAALLTMVYVCTFGGVAVINYFSGIMIKQVSVKVER